MKNKIIFFLILTMTLTSCAETNAAASVADNTYSPRIYTAVAQTLTAAITPTNTVLPTSTPTQTPFPTSTLPIANETPQPTPTTDLSIPDICDNSAYVRDLTIPDGTVLMPGKTFKKIWRLQNTGTCAWRDDYAITFISGFSMEGESTTINKYVAQGKITDIHVDLTAPEVEGIYTGYWLLTNSDGVGFGQQIYVHIVVSEDEDE